MTSEANVATEALRTVHRIHRQLADLKERLVRGPRVAHAHQVNLQGLEAQLAEMKAQAKALQIAIDKKQLQLSTSEATVQKRRLQLSEASSNAEYQALKDEIAAVEMTNSVLTDEILEAMEKMDELDRKVAECQAAVAKRRAETEEARREVDQQKPLIEGDIKRLENELAQCEAALPGDFRDLYRRVVRARGEDALAHVEGEYCGGCNQHVPVNMINELMLSRPIMCKSCGRLLYLPEGNAFQ